MYKLGENCEYGDMTSEMIRDRIIVACNQKDIHLEEVRAGNTAKRCQKCKATGEKKSPKAAGDTNSGLHEV